MGSSRYQTMSLARRSQVPLMLRTYAVYGLSVDSSQRERERELNICMSKQLIR